MEAKGISLHRKGRAVLKSVDLRVYQGEVVALLGANGSGKSTFLSILSGQEKDHQGSVILNGHNVTTLSRSRRKKEGLEVFQTNRKKSNLVQVAESIHDGLQVLCFDEPTQGTALNSLTAKSIHALFDSLKKSGCGVLITNHNVRECLSYVDRAYIIFEGRIIHEGDADTIISEPL